MANKTSSYVHERGLARKYNSLGTRDKSFLTLENDGERNERCLGSTLSVGMEEGKCTKSELNGWGEYHLLT